MKSLFTKVMFLVALSACATSPKPNPRFLVLTTDFGLKDGAVSAMRGVAYTAAPDLVIADLTHEIPPYNIGDAAYRLQQTYSYWPKGTVFVTVVDPGVGSARKSIVAKTRSGFYFVGPDNGHLTLLNEDIEAVRIIDEGTQRRQGSEQSYTFHGRDVYVLVGARLASGQVAFENVGPALNRPIVLLPNQKAEFKNGELVGQIPVLDPNYGNVWTNIPKEIFSTSFPNAKVFNVKIFDDSRKVFEGEIPLVDTFAAAPKGKPLLYFNSLLNAAVALNQGSFAAQHKVGSGPKWTIRIKAK